MLGKVFWAVIVLDAVAAVALWRMLQKGAPGILVLFYLMALAAIVITAALFAVTRADGWRMAALVAFLVTSAPFLLTAVAAKVKAVQSERQFNGKAYFHGPALELAEALVNGDRERVKQVMPAAGDLNQPHGGGMTLWQFGVLQAENTDESMEILRLLVAGGADPRRDTSADSLQHALAKGPQLTRYLLEAGESPNVLDHEKRPLWWRTMNATAAESDGEMLQLMLDHGADIRLRAADGRGSLEVAMANGYWTAVCLLVQRGADWKQEGARGRTVPQLLEWEILRQDDYGIPVPERQRKVLAEMKGVPVAAVRSTVREGDVRIPDLLNTMSVDKLEETRQGLEELAKHPHWVRRLEAFFEGENPERRRQAALLFSMKAERVPESLQEACWGMVREGMEQYDKNPPKSANEARAWRLLEPATLAMGLAAAPGPVRERHREDFQAMRERVEGALAANDPEAGKLPDLAARAW